jgi:quinone-modifying oxidoreductase subunit QmoA
MEDFYTKIKAEENVQFFKGKVAQINQDESNKKLVLKVEDTTAEALHEISVDLVVLATGMQPNTSENPLPVQAPYDDYGFLASQSALPGMYAVGCTRTPTGVQESVQDGTAAALKAIQSITRR